MRRRLTVSHNAPRSQHPNRNVFSSRLNCYSRLGRYLKVNFWELSWQYFILARCPFYCRTNSVKVTNRWQCAWLWRDSLLPPCCHSRSGKLWWLYGLPCCLASRKHTSWDNNSVPDFETACSHHCKPGTLLWQNFLQAGCPSRRPANSTKGY